MLGKDGVPAIESCVKNVDVLSIRYRIFDGEKITDIRILADEIRRSSKPVSLKLSAKWAK